MNEHGEAQRRSGIDRPEGQRRVPIDRRKGQRRVSNVPVAVDLRSWIARREGPPDRRKGSLRVLVTCAPSGGSASIDLHETDIVAFDSESPTGLAEALAVAIARSREEKRPIFVQPN